MDLRERMRARVASKVHSRQWYEIRNADDGVAVVRIYDEIGYWGVTAADFARDFAAIAADKIEVQINSPGGDVFDGIAIYNTIRLHGSHVTTRVDGLAASAASVILQAGDHRVVVQAGQVMIHEAWGVAVGPADEMLEFAALLEQQNDVIAGIYAERSGGDVDEFRSLMAAETWLTDQAAVDLGLADEVLTPAAKARASASVPDPTPTPATSPDPTPAATDTAEEILARFGRRELFGSTALAGIPNLTPKEGS